MHKKSENDKIDLSAIDAIAGGGDDPFIFLAGGAFNGLPGRLIIIPNGPGAYIVEGDIDGNSAADFAFGVNSTTVLDASAFIL